MPVATVQGYDATHLNIGALPPGQAAGYTTGPSWIRWTAADWAAHPGAVRINQDAAASDATADILDVEQYAATPSQCPGWVGRARASFNSAARPGQRWPGIYCSVSVATPVCNALSNAHISDVPLWLAEYYPGYAYAQSQVANGSGPYPVIGFQYSDRGGGGTYDLDVFSVPWLAKVSGAQPPVPAPVPIPGGCYGDTMLELTASGQFAPVTWDPSAVNLYLATAPGSGSMQAKVSWEDGTSATYTLAFRGGRVAVPIGQHTNAVVTDLGPTTGGSNRPIVVVVA